MPPRPASQDLWPSSEGTPLIGTWASTNAQLTAVAAARLASGTTIRARQRGVVGRRAPAARRVAKNPTGQGEPPSYPGRDDESSRPDGQVRVQRAINEVDGQPGGKHGDARYRRQ